MLLKVGAFRSDFDENKNMLFLIKNHKLLEIYNEIWNKVSNTIKKGICLP